MGVIRALGGNTFALLGVVVGGSLGGNTCDLLGGVVVGSLGGNTYVLCSV